MRAVDKQEKRNGNELKMDVQIVRSFEKTNKQRQITTTKSIRQLTFSTTRHLFELVWGESGPLTSKNTRFIQSH